MAKDVKPVLAALNPTTEGLDVGMQQGAGNVKAAVQNTGVALDQVANGLADVGGNTVAGLGETLGQTPAGTLQLVRNLENGGGPVASLLSALFG